MIWLGWNDSDQVLYRNDRERLSTNSWSTEKMEQPLRLPDSTNHVDGFTLEAWHKLLQFAANNPGSIHELLNGSRSSLPATAQLDSRLMRYQLELRERVKRKFAQWDRWLWNREHLEVASDEQTSQMVASNYPANRKIIDIGCGGGADAIALARRGQVKAIDRSEFAVSLTKANAALHSVSMECCINDAARYQPDQDELLHLDPARRTKDHRSIRLDQHSPNREQMLRLVNSSAGGSIKLAPACDDVIDEIDAGLTKQWITCNRSVVQQRWWWGELARPYTRWISSFSISTGWTHLATDANSNDNLGSIVDELDALKSAQFIGDGDPSLRAANVQTTLAAEHGCQLIGDEFGFFVSGQLSKVPLVRWFRVIDVVKSDVKKIRQALRANGMSRVDVKSRGVVHIQPEIQRLANQSGRREGTLFLVRTPAGQFAILGCEVCDDSANNPQNFVTKV
jgi:hypothetical protein